jgi:hypothetical protein
MLSLFLLLLDAGDLPGLPRSVSTWEVQAVDREGRIVPAGGGRQDVALRMSSDRIEVDLGLMGALSLPDGAAGDVYFDDGVYLYYVDDHLRYEDLFDPGWTVAGEFAVLAKLGGPDSASSVGGYLSYAYSRFDGSAAVDPFGRRIQPDELELHAWTLGGRWRTRMSPLLGFQMHVGMGVTHYESVHADVRSGGVSRSGVELMESCNRFTFETGFRVSVHLDRVALVAGLGSRSIAGARSDVEGLAFDPHTLWILDLVLGAELSF